ncbi:addiction module protein [Desulfonatronovibrio hydrogenovorans]|uniref:addiction module protein n=1 Tax=Desulfonatronovibrio hydrogenovorans TaxID=53245 RepID=UPI00048EC363|nr:addiction module protein [Desulfonatronovibrio hydrogenovorans]
MTTLNIEKLSVAERIQVMEIIWDSLAHHQTEIESPQWHYDILKQRKQEIDNGAARFISFEELAARRK